MSRFAIAIAATFTAEPILEAIELWGHELSIDLDVAIAPYDQVLQQILDPESVLRRTPSGLKVLLVRIEDWDRGGVTPAQSVAELVRALQAAATSTAWLLCFCPPSPAARASGRASLHAQAEEAARGELATAGAVHVVTAAALSALYPVADDHDAHGDAVGHIPYTPAMFAALGTVVARRVHALASPPCKVVVTDCDHTLWAGVAGEDGPLGVVVDPPRRALQEMLVAQHDAGALVCLCSRNDDADVMAVLDAQPDMPLRPAHVAARRVSFRPKSESLGSLAAELGLSLDSFVFLDDDPIERAEVRAGCPEVLTAELPRDPAAVPTFLRHFWALDRARSTGEDGRRTALYRDERGRDEARRGAPDLDAFLDGLGLEITVAPLTRATLPRAAQLAQRTNQLNVTTKRRTEAEMEAVSGSGALEALVIDARDRFGDYGTVGLVLFAWTAEALAVDTFLVSCRALGRGVEERVLAHIGRVAQERGRTLVEVPFVPTAKNEPALRLLEAVGTASPEPGGVGCVFRFPASHLAGLRRVPRREALRTPAPVPTAAPARAPSGRGAMLNRIAAELSDPLQIVAAIHRRRWKRGREGAPAAFPRGSVEETLATIWREVLHLEDVGPDEGFFEVGGQSVAMVRVISRIREALGVEVPPPAFFAAPTIAGLARSIAELSERAAAPGEVAALLDLIEGLSPEEVGALLHETMARPEEPPSAARPLLATVALVTHERPAALARALGSYVDNCARHGRVVDFVVMDDSRSHAGRAATRDAILALARTRSAPLHYAGADEKDAFARALVARGLPPSVVRFALAPGRASTAGANRNALLLHTAGEAVFSADDDTICQVAAPPVPGEGIAVSSGIDPADHWFFPDRATALGAASFVDRDVLGEHEALLGRDLRGLLEASPDGGGDPGLRARLAARGGSVLLTFNGLVGDAGWGAPFGAWLAPMGYLAMRGPSLGRLAATEPAYRAAVTSREVVRVVDRIHVSDPAFSMMGFAGLDNRRLLPPFCPIGRGEDNVFGAVLAACMPDACVGHLPWALVHAPAEPRRFWAGEMARTAASADLGRILIEIVRGCALGAEPASPAARMRALGAHLVNLGTMRPSDFEAVVRARLAAANRALAAWLEQGLAAAGGGPAWWADDVRRYVTDLSGAAARDGYGIALDLADSGSLEEARARTQEAIRGFGDLLVCWPAMVDEASLLRARGCRLAVPVQR